MQNKNKYSLWNALSAMAMTLANGLLGIVVTRLVILRFGSDFNGLNSTANQIVNVLLIFEGGFTLASNVALFAPLTRRDDALVNGILVATRQKFRRIGVLFLAAGLAVALLYTLLVRSELPGDLIFCIISMAIFPSAVNLFFATTYRVLLQAEQKEFVINLLTLATISLGHLANLVLLTVGCSMWMVRMTTTLFSLLNSALIIWTVRRTHRGLDLHVPPRGEKIVGTRDVLAQKVTGVIYNAVPIIFLSISPTGGTILASVYAVYNNVFTMVKSILHSFIDAPRQSLGQMIAERKREDVWPVFAQYEYAGFLVIFVFLTTAAALIDPFIRLYTDGVTDANYSDPVIGVLLVLVTAIEMMHIPSGHLINMAGEFRVGRNFQVISCVVLMVSMAIGGGWFGVYGMLSALLLVAILLAVLEMGYIHTVFFRKKLASLFRLTAPLAAVGAAVCWGESRLGITCRGYAVFVLYGVGFVALHSVLALVTGLLFHRRELIPLFRRAWNLMAEIVGIVQR